MPATLTDDVRNELAATMMVTARKWVRRKIRRNPELAEQCQDKAVDAILFSLKHWDGVHPWDRFAWVNIKRFVKGVLHNNARDRKVKRAEVVPLRAGHDEPADQPEQPDVRPALSLDAANRLPTEIRDAVRLHYLDGYSLRECGLLTGVSHEMVRKRLKVAAERLGGLPHRLHRPRAKRSITKRAQL